MLLNLFQTVTQYPRQLLILGTSATFPFYTSNSINILSFCSITCISQVFLVVSMYVANQIKDTAAELTRDIMGRYRMICWSPFSKSTISSLQDKRKKNVKFYFKTMMLVPTVSRNKSTAFLFFSLMLSKCAIFC